MTVTPADEAIAGLVWSAAVTVTVYGFGMLGIFVGAVYVAVYVPEAVMVPRGSPAGTPLTCQVTPALEFCTLAENCRVWATATLAVLGEMLMLAEGGTMVALVLADTDRSVSRSAVMVTTGELGICAGAA